MHIPSKVAISFFNYGSKYLSIIKKGTNSRRSNFIRDKLYSQSLNHYNLRKHCKLNEIDVTHNAP